MHVERECGKAIPWAISASVWPYIPSWRSSRLCVRLCLTTRLCPFAFVDVLTHDAPNSSASDGFAAIWRAGLLHPGDKQKKDAQGRPVARPIVVGLAGRRITGRIPVAELKYFFAQLFAKLRQLGCAIPAGFEIAEHTIALACDHLESLADGGDDEMPSPIQIEFETASTMSTGLHCRKLQRGTAHSSSATTLSVTMG